MVISLIFTHFQSFERVNKLNIIFIFKIGSINVDGPVKYNVKDVWPYN